MKPSFRFTLTLFALSLPSFASAQNTARIECPRNDGYVYLYSSVITLDVRATLQCGEIVQIIGRDETYLAVRTAKGETGFVPMASAAILKDRAASAASTQPAPARERQRRAPRRSRARSRRRRALFPRAPCRSTDTG